MGHRISRLYCAAFILRFALEHFEELLFADLESLRLAIDFGFDILVGNFDPPVLAVVRDQPLVDEAFQNFVAVSLAASGGERIAANILTVHDGHHIVLRLLHLRHLCGRLLRAGVLRG